MESITQSQWNGHEWSVYLMNQYVKGKSLSTAFNWVMLSFTFAQPLFGKTTPLDFWKDCPTWLIFQLTYILERFCITNSSLIMAEHVPQQVCYRPKGPNVLSCSFLCQKPSVKDIGQAWKVLLGWNELKSNRAGGGNREVWGFYEFDHFWLLGCFLYMLYICWGVYGCSSQILKVWLMEFVWFLDVFDSFAFLFGIVCLFASSVLLNFWGAASLFATAGCLGR